jgi:hypothetical protein
MALLAIDAIIASAATMSTGPTSRILRYSLMRRARLRARSTCHT